MVAFVYTYLSSTYALHNLYSRGYTLTPPRILCVVSLPSLYYTVYIGSLVFSFSRHYALLTAFVRRLDELLLLCEEQTITSKLISV